jgi:glycosyltransferase involved in cell wall biosynthesis
MKIAYIGQKGIPMTQGGVEAHVENLAIEMAKKGHDVFVYTRPHYTDSKLKEYQGVKLISLKSIQSKHLDAISHTFLASIHALFQNYDIIHYHSVGPAIFSFIPRLFSKAKVIGTFHCIDRFHQKWGGFARLMLKFGEWSICKFPDTTISVSPHIQKYCNQKYHRKTPFIPNGFKINKDLSDEILKKYNLKSKKYFLAVSRLIKHKGLHYLIEAFQKLNNPEYKLVIVGDTFHNQKYKDYLEKISQNREDIIFTGIQNGAALDQLFSNAFTFVLPSEDEGFSITLLEALAHHIPVIASDIEANQYFIKRDLLHNFLNTNVENLKSKMEDILHNSNSLKNQKMIDKAYQHITTNFSWDYLGNKIDELYSLNSNNRETKSIKKFILSTLKIK